MGRLASLAAANIRRIRRAKGLTLEKLAAACPMDLKNLGKIERGEGNPELKTLESIAAALKVDALHFFQPPPGTPGAKPDLDAALASLKESMTLVQEAAGPYAAKLSRRARRKKRP